MYSKRLRFRSDNEYETSHDDNNTASEEVERNLPDTEIQSGDGEKSANEPPQKRQRFELGTDN